MERRLDAHRQDAPRVERVDDPVVPESGGREVWRALALVRLEDRRLERIAVGVRREAATDRGQDPRRLLPTHDGDPAVRPRPQESRLVGPAGHRVVPGSETPPDEDRELRDFRIGDRHDQFRAVLGDARLFVFAPDHEPGDVLEEDERDPALAGELDEVGALERRLAEQDPVIGEDGDRVAAQMGKAGHECLAVEWLEFVEARAIHEPGDDLSDGDRSARVGRDGGVQRGRAGTPFRSDRGWRRIASLPWSAGARAVQVRHDGPAQRQRMLVVQGLVVGDPGAAGVDLGASELFGRDVLPGGSLHEGRPAQEDRASALDDHGLVAHRRHVRASGGAAAHDQRDLWDARC